MQLRSEALVANAADPVVGSTFARNDCWWWNQAQTVNGQTLTLVPVATGIQGGLPGGSMTMTGSYNLSGNVPPGLWRLAYIVATGEVKLSGLIASGSHGFNVMGGPASQMPSCPDLDYETGTIGGLCPEPSTLGLMCTGLVGSLVVVGRRRK